MASAIKSPNGRFSAALLILGTIAVYGALLLWPFHWNGASFGNGAEAVPGGGVRFESPGIALAKEPLDWLEHAASTETLSLSLRFRSDVARQTGPARIISLSKDAFERDLTVAQDRRDLVLRIRLPGTDRNGLVDNLPVARVRDVFPTPGFVDLTMSIEPGTLRLTLDGEQILEDSLPPSALDGWDLSYGLALGNELTYDRPWIGEIQRAAVRTGDLIVDYACQDRLTFPHPALITTKPPKLTPLKNLNLQDAFNNVLLFVPFGLLLGLLINGGKAAAGRWHLALGAILLMAAVSAGFETLQIFVPRRAPSVDDLIFNILGGGVSLFSVLAWGLRWTKKTPVDWRRPSAPRPIVIFWSQT